MDLDDEHLEIKEVSIILTTSRLIAAGVLFLLTIISGMILSQSTRPLRIGLVTLHKLIAVGAMVLLGMVVNQLFRTVEGRALVELGLAVIGGLLFLSLVATGALLTREEMRLPTWVLTIHRATPVPALAPSGIAISLLAQRWW